MDSKEPFSEQFLIEPFFSRVMNILIKKLLPSGGVSWMLNSNV